MAASNISEAPKPPESGSSLDVLPSPPFTEQNSTTDLVLETADGDRFFVAKAILIQASSVFETMLSLPQPDVSERSNGLEFDGGRPVVKVTERSRTLDTLLRICYPIRSPQLENMDLTEIEQILQAALKYDMDVATFEIRNALNAPRFRDPMNALAIFVMAYRNGWEDDARRAAYDTLKGRLIQEYNPALDHIKASVYHKLLQYHRNATKEVMSLFDNKTTFFEKLPLGIHTYFNCRNSGCANRTVIPCCSHHVNSISRGSWPLRFCDRARELARDVPLSGEMFALPVFAKSSSGVMCSGCMENILTHWTAIASALTEYRECSLSAVKIDLTGMHF